MPSLFVNELFVSIQGETSWCGYPCFFIRLAGCNLRCRYCDTPRALDEGGGVKMDVKAIVRACRGKNTPLIAVTGGEPLHQDAVPDLLHALFELNPLALLVETNGSYDIGKIPFPAVVIMDVKCPGSGAVEAMDAGNIERLRAQDEVKFVLSDRFDYEFALNFVSRHRLHEHCRHVLFVPAAGRLDARVLAQWLLADRPPARLQLQIHRLLSLA